MEYLPLRQDMQWNDSNKPKGDLLPTVLHELCTPLTAIKGYACLLLDCDYRLAHDEKLECLHSINSATDRLTELVENLLDMSRGQAGRLKLQKEPASISKLIQEAVVEAQVRASGHRLVSKVERGLPAVTVDARRIRQVLDNLIDNATKYSKEGSTVAVGARRAGPALLVSVSDEGMGIPAEDLDRVFDWMYRAESGESSSKRGFGLGLAICKQLVEAHGGRIWMESEEGRGSVCSFVLPL